MTIVAGQFDHHEEGTLLGFERLNPEVRSHSRLVLGAWNHSFEVTPTHTPHAHAKEFDITLDQFEWFYQLLIEHRTPQQEVKVYDIEADKWEQFDSWPLKPSALKLFYLTAQSALKDGKKNVLRLEEKAPVWQQVVEYTYDPPSGEIYNMRTSIMTLGYRDGLLLPRVSYQPGETVEVEIVALPMLWTVKAGNRLRLDIKSSQFPEYAVHSNFAGGWAEQPVTKIAHQEVMTGGPEGARIIIPIIGNN